MTYIAVYAHADTDMPGSLELDATTDAEAIAEIKQLVESGYRNGTWATVELSDGRTASYCNRHGEAVGGHGLK
ncbi:MAG TPA: hypothetical protein PLB26_06845 [Rubrivivax sp.]|nr:hypothetical protein [Rubrivivax sp.]